MNDIRFVMGVIVALDGQYALVDVQVQEGGCGRCHEQGGCGSQNLSRALCAKTYQLRIENTLGVGVGDTVSLGMRNETLSCYATRIYFFPLLGLLIGAAVGQSMGGFEANLDAAIGGVLGLLLVVALSRVMARKPAELPYMAKILRSEGGV